MIFKKKHKLKGTGNNTFQKSHRDTQVNVFTENSKADARSASSTPTTFYITASTAGGAAALRDELTGCPRAAESGSAAQSEAASCPVSVLLLKMTTIKSVGLGLSGPPARYLLRGHPGGCGGATEVRLACTQKVHGCLQLLVHSPCCGCWLCCLFAGWFGGSGGPFTPGW